MKNTQPIFTKAPLVGMATVTAANANLDGSGAIVTVASGLTEGIRIDVVEVKAIVTTTAGMIRLFLSEDNGVTWELWHEIDVTAVTPGAAVQAFSASYTPTNPLSLATSDDLLGASTENAEEMNVFARGGELAA